MVGVGLFRFKIQGSRFKVVIGKFLQDSSRALSQLLTDELCISSIWILPRDRSYSILAQQLSSYHLDSRFHSSQFYLLISFFPLTFPFYSESTDLLLSLLNTHYSLLNKSHVSNLISNLSLKVFLMPPIPTSNLLSFREFVCHN